MATVRARSAHWQVCLHRGIDPRPVDQIMKFPGPRRYPCPQWPEVRNFPRWQILLFMVDLPGKDQ
eukprot:1559310-Karenia_brevis.AAC.1